MTTRHNLRPYTIVGIIGDIDLYGAYNEAPNSMIACPPEIVYNEWGWNHNIITVKLKPPYKENLNKLNEAVAEAYPDAHAEFMLMTDVVKMQYSDIRIFRNSVLTTSVIILLTTLMGLIGFVADEIQRRRKEIAIRKVNGAETADILALISRNIMLVAIPAVGRARARKRIVRHKRCRGESDAASYRGVHIHQTKILWRRHRHLLHCQRTFGALHRRLQMVCPVTLPLHRHR